MLHDGAGHQERRARSSRVDGARLGEPASAHGVVGCRAVPLSSLGETWGALSLYWGSAVRDENLLPTGIAVAAIAVRAIEAACAQDEHRRAAAFPVASVSCAVGRR